MLCPGTRRGRDQVKASPTLRLAALLSSLTAMHSDSGLEFLNAHVLGYARDRPRPRLHLFPPLEQEPDNEFMLEQKNASVVREYFGYEHRTASSFKKDMDVPCAKISLYNNLPPLQRPSPNQKVDPHGF